jgi:nucleotide-binding universal stress UspA family protein
METLTVHAPRPQEGVRAHHAAPVIVATDGRDQSDSAVLAGLVLAGDADALRILSVLQPVPIVSPEVQLPISPEAEQARRTDLESQIAAQVERMLGDIKPSVELLDGDPASMLAKAARESNARLIVAGLGKHRVLDRLFGDETALRLLRVSPVPVLAVSSTFAGAPQRIVVAMDFSETSIRAARMALELAGESAAIYLAHVGPRDSSVTAWNGWGPAYKTDAGMALARVADTLRIPHGMSVQRVILHGDPATELLAFAASVNADLIATGSHGHGFVARMLIGSVATKLVRYSTCSVLSVPHTAAIVRDGLRMEPPAVVSLPKLEWAAQLDAFTRRNVGRRGILEVDDPELGAQAQEHDYPLLGATYDHHDERVELMVGELGSVDRHLTRSIGDVQSIDVLTNDRGRDVALRIAHGAGQTLLTFSRA